MFSKKSIKEDRFKKENDYTFSSKEICKSFLKEYNKKNKKDYHFVRPGDSDKGEPSCICTDHLNLEISQVYYNKEEAKSVWDFVHLMKKRQKETNINRKNKVKKDFQADANQLFCDSLNERINSKSSIEYNFSGKIILLVEEGIGFTGKEAVDYFNQQGKNFENKIFDEIWLMLNLAGYYKIYQLK